MEFDSKNHNIWYETKNREKLAFSWNTEKSRVIFWAVEGVILFISLKKITFTC